MSSPKLRDYECFKHFSKSLKNIRYISTRRKCFAFTSLGSDIDFNYLASSLRYIFNLRFHEGRFLISCYYLVLMVQSFGFFIWVSMGKQVDEKKSIMVLLCFAKIPALIFSSISFSSRSKVSKLSY